MEELVNIILEIEGEVRESGISLRLDGDRLLVLPPSGKPVGFELVRLHRASSGDVKRAAASHVVLILSQPTQKALEAASRYNHIAVPGGGFRLIAPGVALFRESPGEPSDQKRSVRLRRRTGVVAEALLLAPNRAWTVTSLARESEVSPALAHRVLARLDEIGLTDSFGAASQKVRRLTNPRALAELWSQEEAEPAQVARGYVYGSDIYAVARKVAATGPNNVAVGGVLAANDYHPVLTRVNPPVRLWVPGKAVALLQASSGFEAVEEGANVELSSAPLDPWRVKMRAATKSGLNMVSPWRAWVEISRGGGRTRELADELIERLITGIQNGDA